MFISKFFQDKNNKKEMTEEVDDFMIPPTPTRVGCLLLDQSNDSFQDSFLNDAGDGSLALLTGEVVVAQKYQASELSSKEEQLKTLKTEADLYKATYEAVQNDVKSVTRQLYLIQDKVCESQNNCSHLQKDIVDLLEQKRRLQAKHLDLKWKQKQADAQFNRYREKMMKFRDKVQTFHKQNKISIEIMEMKDAIEAQRKQLVILSNEEDSVKRDYLQSQEEIADSAIITDTLESDIVEIQGQICKEKEYASILRKETDALHKRHTAQTSRLKRQLQESRNRVERWNGENSLLREKIAVLKEK